MSHGDNSEPAGYIEQAARVGWGERGSFGFEVVRRTARDMTAEEHFFADYTIVPLAGTDDGQAVEPNQGSR